MARRRSAHGRNRGGGAIQAPVKERPRVALSVAAVLLAAPLATVPALTSPRDVGGPLLLLGAAGWILLLVSVGLGLASLVAPALALLGAAFALSLGSGLDGRAPLYAGLFLLVAELSYWSLDLRLPIRAEPGTVRSRGLFVAVIVVAAVAFSGSILAFTAVPALPGGAAWEAVGVVAAAAALALVLTLARPRA